MYLIKKVSEISSVSVRTLHHYDKIGLLSPKRHENGYRYYCDDDMSTLQTILYYKYLGFTLTDIKILLEKGEKDRLSHFKRQLSLLKDEKRKLLTLIDTLEKTIVSNERRLEMSTKEKFHGFTYEDTQKYREEASKKYGKEVIEESISRQKGKEEKVTEGFNTIFFAFSENRSKKIASTSKENVALAKKLHEHIRKYSFDCSHDVFSKIGYGYTKNNEFKENIDKFGKGTAEYACEAIQQYVSESSH